MPLTKVVLALLGFRPVVPDRLAETRRKASDAIAKMSQEQAMNSLAELSNSTLNHLKPRTK